MMMMVTHDDAAALRGGGREEGAEEEEEELLLGCTLAQAVVSEVVSAGGVPAKQTRRPKTDF
jgi:hypothetical protein